MPYDLEKIAYLRKQIYAIRKKLSDEYNPTIRKRLFLEIRIIEMKIMVEKLK
jgi:hypothetical protein